MLIKPKCSDNTPYEKVGDKVRSLAEEIPFEIPNSWAWCRLGDYAEKVTDQVASGSFASLRENVPSLKEPNYAIMVKTADFSNGFTRNLTYTTKNGYDFLENSNLYGGELILSNIGSIGKCFIVPHLNYRMTLAPNAVMIRLTEEILRDYLYYLILSPFGFLSLMAITSGTAMKKFNKTDLKTILIPIPPVNEQLRIVEAIKRIEPYVDNCSIKEEELEILNKDFPSQLRKSILQMAVQGKLVPQNSNDEPASALLDRIRAEKESLIKEGNIKRDKSESVIFRRDNSHYEKRDGKEICIDEEIPFEIPSTWAWARTSSLGSMIRGKGIKRNETTPAGFPCIRYGEIYTTYNTSFSKAKSFVSSEVDSQCLHFSHGDIVFTLTGENKVDIAKAVAFLGDGSVAAGGDLAFWTAHGMNPLYLVYYMASPYCIEQKRRIATGDIIVHISTEKVGGFLIPIPPLKEQERIVNAIKDAFEFIETL